MCIVWACICLPLSLADNMSKLQVSSPCLAPSSAPSLGPALAPCARALAPPVHLSLWRHLPRILGPLRRRPFRRSRDPRRSRSCARRASHPSPTPNPTAPIPRPTAPIPPNPATPVPPNPIAPCLDCHTCSPSPNTQRVASRRAVACRSLGVPSFQPVGAELLRSRDHHVCIHVPGQG